MDTVIARPYNGATDFAAVGRFLVDTYSRHGWMYNWGIERWEIQRFSVTTAAELAGKRTWEQYTRIWEVDREIVGVAHPEDGGDLWVEVDPDFRYLEDEMFAWGEQHRSPAHPSHGPLVTYVVDGDSLREPLLRKRGWTRGELKAHLRRRSMPGSLPTGPVPDGYVVRSLDLSTERDSKGRAAISRASFGHERTGEMTRVLAQAPSYLPELDLAAIAPDGTFAAYTTVWWEPVNRYIIFEPVGTHPEHRRRGLASAVMAEGLRRSMALDPVTAYVGSGAGQPSNTLYDSLGFNEVTNYIRWEAPSAGS
mgnify:CR=1 FL=1